MVHLNLVLKNWETIKNVLKSGIYSSDLVSVAHPFERFWSC